MSKQNFSVNLEVIREILNEMTSEPITKEYILKRLNKTNPRAALVKKDLEGIQNELVDNRQDFSDPETNELESIASALTEYLKKFDQ